MNSTGKRRHRLFYTLIIIAVVLCLLLVWCGAIATPLSAWWRRGGTAPLGRDDARYYAKWGSAATHARILADHIRVSTFAHFIHHHVSLFHSRVVLDVGAGTGLLR
jgi:hypothetical protein